MTEILPSMIQDARDYAASIHERLAAHALDSDFGFAAHVTHAQKLAYASQQEQLACEIKQGKHDNNFTVWQRMHFFVTGESVPLLP